VIKVVIKMVDFIINLALLSIIIGAFFIGINSIITGFKLNRITFLPDKMLINRKKLIINDDKNKISHKNKLMSETVALKYDEIKLWQIDVVRKGGQYGEAVKKKYSYYPLSDRNELMILIKTIDNKNIDFIYSMNKEKNLRKYVGEKETKATKFIKKILIVRTITRILSIIILLFVIYTIINGK
jgi:hypothetical protein